MNLKKLQEISSWQPTALSYFLAMEPLREAVAALLEVRPKEPLLPLERQTPKCSAL